MRIGRRIFAYGLAALISLFVLSCIAIYRHKDFLAQYFSTSLSAYGNILLYVLIFGVGIVLMLKAILK